MIGMSDKSLPGLEGASLIQKPAGLKVGRSRLMSHNAGLCPSSNSKAITHVDDLDG